MAAPLTRGIIIATAVIVAAGVAAYESPEFRAWADRSRRKVAMALHRLGDEIHPKAELNQRSSARNTEDRGRGRSDVKQQDTTRGTSDRRGSAGGSDTFDTLLHKDGTLRDDIPVGQSTSLEKDDQSTVSLRRRGADGWGSGARFANPFADELSDTHEDCALIGPSKDEFEDSAEHQALHEQSGETLTVEAPQDGEQQDHEIRTDAATFGVPSSAYWSVSEWAENTSPSYYASEEVVTDDNVSESSGMETPTDTLSLAGSDADVSENGRSLHGDIDTLSDIGGVNTPSSWTEVGSEVSEGEHLH